MPSHPLAPMLAVLTAGTLAIALPAQADPLRVQASGVFTDETPATDFSAPGAAWTMSFIVDRNPVPGDPLVPGALFAVPVQDFHMTVGGLTIGPPLRVQFFAEAAGGGMNLVFGSLEPDGGYKDSFGSYGQAFYSGSESAPTIVPGSYTTQFPGDEPGATGLYLTHADADYYWQPETVFTISAVPLPPSAALMAGGLLALAGVARRRRSR